MPERDSLPPQPAAFDRKPSGLELGFLPIHGNLADNGKLFLRSLRIAALGTVLADDLRMSARARCESLAHRPVPPHSAGVLRSLGPDSRSRFRDSRLNGQRALEDALRNHFSRMGTSFHVFSKRNQRPPLVHSLRHDGWAGSRGGHGGHYQNAKKIRMGMTCGGCGNPACVTLRVHRDSISAGRRTPSGMVPNVQPFLILNALPPLNGLRMSGDIRGNEKGETFLLVRRRLRRLDRGDVLVPLDNTGKRRFRVFLAEWSVQVPSRSHAFMNRDHRGGVY